MIESQPEESVWTKRKMAKIYAKIYDPLGFISPFIIVAKILLSETWKMKMDWDDPLPDEVVTRWVKWLQCLPQLKEIRVPRPLRKAGFDRVSAELHVYPEGGHGYSLAIGQGYLQTWTDRLVDWL